MHDLIRSELDAAPRSSGMGTDGPTVTRPEALMIRSVCDSEGFSDFECEGIIPVQGLELLIAAVAVKRLQDVRLDVRCDAGGVGVPGRGLPAELRREPLLTAAWQQVAGAVLPAVLRNGEEGCRGTLAQVTTGQPPGTTSV